MKPTPAPAVCHLLRTKSAFGQTVGQDWRAGEDPTAAHWCLATLEPFGPDEHLVHARECGPGRRCYQPAPGDEGLLVAEAGSPPGGEG